MQIYLSIVIENMLIVNDSYIVLTARVEKRVMDSCTVQGFSYDF